jgi:hypothetical protein
MGIYYGAAVVVGLRQEDLLKVYTYDSEEEMCLRRFSQFYDYDDDDSIIGISVHSANPISELELSPELNNKIFIAKYNFRLITGVEAKLFLTVSVH